MTIDDVPLRGATDLHDMPVTCPRSSILRVRRAYPEFQARGPCVVGLVRGGAEVKSEEETFGNV